MRALILIISLILIVGCSSQTNKYARDLEKAKAHEIKRKNTTIESHIESLPEWVISPPKADALGMYAVGLGESDKLSTAIKKARLEAEFGLAKLYSQELSGSERLYETDSSTSSDNRYIGLIDKLIDEVPVVGFSTEKQEIMANSGKYAVYVLLKLPYDEFNAVLKNQQDNESRQSMQKAFRELERRLDRRKSEGF